MSLRQSAIDAYRCHGYAKALLQPWALSNKLSIRLWPPLVIGEVSFRSLQGAECSKREKPCRSSIDSIAKVTSWPHFLNAYKERHNAGYRGTADLRLHTCQDSSKATTHCQQEKRKTEKVSLSRYDIVTPIGVYRI